MAVPLNAMPDIKVSNVSALPDLHNKAVCSDHPSPDQVSTVSTALPDNHSKAACSDHPLTHSDSKSTIDNQPTNVSSSSECHSNLAHTALPIAKNQAALPPPPAKICKPAAPTAGPVKDFIYKVPPPLPDDHPSKAAARNLRRRCSPCARCIICVSSLLLTIILLLAIAFLLFYITTEPRLPKYDIESLTISKLNFTKRTSKMEAVGAAAAEYVSAEMAVRISMRNPNKKMRVYHRGVGVSVQFKGVVISEGAMEASMNQSPGNTTVVQVMVHADMVRLEGDVAGSLKESLASLAVQVDILTHVTLKFGDWTSRHVSVHVGCWVHVTFPATSAFSKSCDIKVASKRVPFLLLFPSK